MVNQTITPEPAKNYVAPRDEPLKYPGPRPNRSFIVANEMVHPILYDAQETGEAGSTYAGRVVTGSNGNTQRIDDFLKSQGKSPLRERYGVLGFG